MECNATDSNDETKKMATYDPGWNDPPLFSFDTTVQSKASKKTLLNKRVAFPMTSQQPSIRSPAISTTIPVAPPPAVPTASGHTTENVADICESDENLQKEEALQKVMQIFEDILTDASDELKKNGVEIRRRVDIMKKMWEEDKLKPEIHVKMVQLSEALSSGNRELADHIHMGLMVDHVSLCSPWMAGVRQLIHRIKTQSTEIKKQEQSSEGIPLTAN